MNKLRLVIVVAGLSTVLIAIQNCQRTELSNPDEANARQLAAVSAPDSEDGTEAGQPRPGTTPAPAPVPAPGHSGSCANDPRDLVFVCILDGPGKSVKLGLTGGVAAGDESIPDSLCMSQRACKSIASQVFKVKGPEARGYCKNGKAHTLAISDRDLQMLVDKMK